MKKIVGLLLMMTLICATNVSGADMSDYPLLAHWDFEGAAGTTAITDEVSGRAATIMGGASLNGSGGVELAGGTSGQYVDLGSSLGSLIGSLSGYRIEITFDWDGPATGTAQKWWTFSQEGTTEFAMLTAVTSNNAYTRYQYRRDASDTMVNRAYSSDIVDESMTIGIDYNPTLGTGGYGAVQTFKNYVFEAYSTQTRDVSLSLLGNTTRNYIGKSPYDAGNYFDGTVTDFKIYGIPEPATISLLGIGLLAFVRRRK